jgi:hypothetical protein
VSFVALEKSSSLLFQDNAAWYFALGAWHSKRDLHWLTFYASSTIRNLVFSLIHTTLLPGALINESKPETQTLLYQMVHFWSMRINKRNVDGKLE